MKRALRRHHRKRIIRKFQRIYRNWDYENWFENGLYTAGRGSIRCGCGMCISPRRGGYGDSPLTIQERKALEDANDQLNSDYKYVNGCVLDLAYINTGCDCYECRPDLYEA